MSKYRKISKSPKTPEYGHDARKPSQTRCSNMD